jgi:NitT/TauT family transport system substrate-binding protein
VFNAGPALMEALFAGEIDIAYVGPGPILNAHQKSRGEAIRVIAGAAANGVMIVARSGSGVGTVAGLARARVATPQHGNTQDIAARHYLVSHLRQRGATGVIPVANAEQAAMMQRGQIDVAWVPEPWGSRLIVEHGATLVAHEKDLWPQQQFALTLVVTTPEFLAAHAGVVKQVLRVHCEWTDRLQEDPQRYRVQLGDALYALSGKRLPEGVLPRAVDNVQYTLDPLPETVQTIGQWSFNLGFARRPPDMTGLIDLSLLQQVQEADAHAVH